MISSARFAVAIIGGGAIGSAAAFFLKRAGVDRICIIEPDPTYSKAATPLATGGCRRLFSRPENIEMSKFSIDFFKRFTEHIAVNGEAPEIGWKEWGYLFVVPPGDEQVLERNYKVQAEHGVKVELLDQKALKARYPWLHCDDLALGALSPEDGWLDPNGVLQGLRKKAIALGVTQIKDRVVDLFVSEHRVRSVELASGNRVEADYVINAAGTWAASLAKLVGMNLPVNPMRRFEHYVEIEQALPPMPLLKDPARLVSRPEGKGYSVGLVDGKEPRGFNFDVEPGYFERVVWPALAQRIPAFESLKLKREWAGLYDENELDGNMILGNWPGLLENFIVACGFSGHGLMHAPAVGRALAELVVHGRYETIDLTRMDYQRVLDNKPYAETGII
jgi:FAD-dependent oxidoreductase domain-containing protein 1